MAWHSEHCNWLLEQVEMIKWWKTSAKVCSQSARLTELIESRGHRVVSFKRKTNDNFLSLPLTQYSMVHQRAFCNGIRWSQANQIYFWYFLTFMLPTHTYFHFVCTTETYKWNQNQREKSNAKTQMLLAWIGSFEVVVLFIVVVVFLQDGILVVAECQVKFHAVFGPDSFQSVWSANKL